MSAVSARVAKELLGIAGFTLLMVAFLLISDDQPFPGFGGLNLPETTTEKDQARTTINLLTQAGIAVDVLGYSPMFSLPVPQLLASRLTDEDGRSRSTPTEQYDEAIWEKDEALARWETENTSARYVKLMEILCPAKECELLVDDRSPIYVDHSHMSREGSIWFGSFLAARLFE